LTATFTGHPITGILTNRLTVETIAKGIRWTYTYVTALHVDALRFRGALIFQGGALIRVHTEVINPIKTHIAYTILRGFVAAGVMGTIRFIDTGTGHRIAYAHPYAPIGRGADNGLTKTGPGIASVPGGTGVAIVANRPLRRELIHTGSIHACAHLAKGCRGLTINGTGTIILRSGRHRPTGHRLLFAYTDANIASPVIRRHAKEDSALYILTYERIGAVPVCVHGEGLILCIAQYQQSGPHHRLPIHQVHFLIRCHGKLKTPQHPQARCGDRRIFEKHRVLILIAVRAIRGPERHLRNATFMEGAALPVAVKTEFYKSGRLHPVGSIVEFIDQRETWIGRKPFKAVWPSYEVLCTIRGTQRILFIPWPVSLVTATGDPNPCHEETQK